MKFNEQNIIYDYIDIILGGKNDKKKMLRKNINAIKNYITVLFFYLMRRFF